MMRIKFITVWVLWLAIFISGASQAGTWSQTEQSEFESCTLSNIDTSTSPGNITLSGAYSPDDNTVLLLHFNEGSGTTATDSSGNGNILCFRHHHLTYY